jgi:hypothetical protein
MNFCQWSDFWKGYVDGWASCNDHFVFLISELDVDTAGTHQSWEPRFYSGNIGWPPDVCSPLTLKQLFPGIKQWQSSVRNIFKLALLVPSEMQLFIHCFVTGSLGKCTAPQLLEDHWNTLGNTPILWWGYHCGLVPSMALQWLFGQGFWFTPGNMVPQVRVAS